MLDEMLVMLVRSGFYGGNPEVIADLDMLSFQAAAETVVRVGCYEKEEQAWTSMVAAQGDVKTMKKWAKQWKQIAADVSGTEVDTSDEQAFLAKVGKGL